MIVQSVPRRPRANTTNTSGILLFHLIWGLLTFFVLYCWIHLDEIFKLDQDPIAWVLQQHGQIKTRHLDVNLWKNLGGRKELYRNEIISTGPNSYAIIKFQNDKSLKIEENSQILVQNTQNQNQSKSLDQQPIKITLVKGNIKAVQIDTPTPKEESNFFKKILPLPSFFEKAQDKPSQTELSKVVETKPDKPTDLSKLSINETLKPALKAPELAQKLDVNLELKKVDAKEDFTIEVAGKVVDIAPNFQIEKKPSEVAPTVKISKKLEIETIHLEPLATQTQVEKKKSSTPTTFPTLKLSGLGNQLEYTLWTIHSMTSVNVEIDFSRVTMPPQGSFVIQGTHNSQAITPQTARSGIVSIPLNNSPDQQLVNVENIELKIGYKDRDGSFSDNLDSHSITIHINPLISLNYPIVLPIVGGENAAMGRTGNERFLIQKNTVDPQLLWIANKNIMTQLSTKLYGGYVGAPLEHNSLSDKFKIMVIDSQGQLLFSTAENATRLGISLAQRVGIAKAALSGNIENILWIKGGFLDVNDPHFESAPKNLWSWSEKNGELFVRKKYFTEPDQKSFFEENIDLLAVKPLKVLYWKAQQ